MQSNIFKESDVQLSFHFDKVKDACKNPVCGIFKYNKNAGIFHISFTTFQVINHEIVLDIEFILKHNFTLKFFSFVPLLSGEFLKIVGHNLEIPT